MNQSYYRSLSINSDKMTTHLTSWSKMSFQKKSKATASVGNPSPKFLQRSKSSRSTKSEVKVDPDTDNNNSQESLEQELDKKLNVESKFWVKTPFICVWFLFLWYWSCETTKWNTHTFTSLFFILCLFASALTVFTPCNSL